MRLSKCRGQECKVKIIHYIQQGSFIKVRHQLLEEIQLEECTKIHLSKSSISKLVLNSHQNNKTTLVVKLNRFLKLSLAARKLVKEVSRFQLKLMHPDSKAS